MNKSSLSSIWTAFAVLCLMVSFQNCRKDLNQRNIEVSDMVREAKDIFSKSISTDPLPISPDNPGNARTRSQKQVQWDKAAIISFRNHEAVQVPIHFDNSFFMQTGMGGRYRYQPDNQAKLLMYKDSLQKWHTELVTYLPDSIFILKGGKAKFSGIVLVDDWWGNPLNKYKYNPDGSRYRYTRGAVDSRKPGSVASNAVTSNAISVCLYIQGYNYSPSDPDGGEYWEEFVGCYLMYDPDDEGGGGGGGGGNYGDTYGGGGGGAPATPPPPSKPPIVVSPPYLVITDLKAYLKCFTDASGVTYQVSLCVDQPEPGTRTPWVWQGDGSSGSISPVNAGHSFLVLTETWPGGWSITRNIGFYPSGSVTPGSDPVVGVFNDDSPHGFDVGGTWTLNSSTFFAMTNFIQNFQGQYYQVNTNNCTNFVLDALGAGHIYLPYTIGGWLGGTGVDPGDLGEDIRSHNYQNMAPLAPNTPHPTVGDCN